MSTTLPLKDIVDVSITVQTSAPGSAAFDVTMILDTENVLNTLPGTTPINPVIRTYSDLDGMTTDGFLPWHRAYRLAQAIFGQDNRPETIKVTGYNSTIGSGDPTTFLTAVRAADPAWYVLLATVEVDATTASTVTFAEQCATWSETTDTGKSLFLCEGVGATEKGASANVFSYFKTHTYENASGWWHTPTQGWYALTLSADLIASNSTTFELNGDTVTVAYNTNNNTTIGDIITALKALKQVDGTTALLAQCFALQATGDHEHTIIMQATAPNEALSLTDFAITGGTSQALATFGECGKTIGIVTFSAALVALNSTILAFNGHATTATVYAADSDTTLGAIATKVAALTGIGYAAVIPVSGSAGADDRQILVVSADDGARLDLTSGAVTLGASQATIAYALQPVSPDYQLTAAAIGECISATPGTKSWANRKLAIVTADLLSETDYGNITGNYANCYAAFSQNRNATRIGTVATGLTIRNKILKDALELALQLAVFDALQNADLVPDTNAGRLAIKAVIDGVGGQYVASGALASFTSQVPARSAGPAVGGVLSGVTFQAVSAGEIQKVIIKGTLQA